MLSRTSKSRGFTLIELLVVIAIIGILSSVVIVSLTSARKKSRDARRLTDMKALATALELHYTGNNYYPESQNGTCANGSYFNLSESLSALVSSGAIPALPKDPNPRACEYNYFYVTSGTNPQTYTLMVNLETNDASIYSDHWCVGATNDPTANGNFPTYRMCSN